MSGRFQLLAHWCIRPLERALHGRVSANAITAASLIGCAIAGAAVAFGYLGVAVCVYAIAGILDILDGRIARLEGNPTAAGALLDSVADRWGELFVFAGYAWYLRVTPWMLAVIGALGASLMVSYTRARAESLGVNLRGGMMQRAERIVLVTGGTLVAEWYGGHAVVPILGATMLICALTSAATAANRWIVAFRELSRRAGRTGPLVGERREHRRVVGRILALARVAIDRR